MGDLIRIGDICNVRSSKRVFEDDWKSEGIPFYRAREVVLLNKNGFVDNSLFIEKKKYNELVGMTGCPKVGDILVTAVGTLGVTHVVKDSKPFYFKDGNLLWIEVPQKINPFFLQYLFISNVIKEQIKNFALTTTVGTYTISSAKKTIIPNLSFEEQTAIANFLDEKTSTIDSAVGELENQRRLLKELKQITIHKAVTKGLDDNIPMKDSGVEWIGEVPVGWGVKRIKDEFKYLRLPKANENESEYIEIGDVNIEDNSYSVVDKTKGSVSGAKKAEKDTLLISTVRPNRGGITITQKSHPVSSAFCCFELKNRFLFYLVKSPLFLKELTKSSMDTTYPTCKDKDIYKKVVSFPNENEQRKIAKELDKKTSKINKSIKEINSKIIFLKEYKKTLINDAVTGKIKVYEGDV